MAHRYCYEAVDRLYRDIMKSVDPRLEFVPFGGKVILFAGDFRQTLPIIPRGSRAKTVNASLKKSHLWTQITRLRLSINMRVQLLQQQGHDSTNQVNSSPLTNIMSIFNHLNSGTLCRSTSFNWKWHHSKPFPDSTGYVVKRTSDYFR